MTIKRELLLLDLVTFLVIAVPAYGLLRAIYG